MNIILFKYLYKLLILFLFFYNADGFINKTDNEIVYEYSKPLDCSSTSYFDPSTFTCRKCPNNLISTENRLHCICDERSKYLYTINGDPMCELCDNESSPTAEKFDCITCSDNSTCQCADNEIRIERHRDGTLLDIVKCMPCPEHSYPSIDNSKCLPCSAIRNNYIDNNHDYEFNYEMLNILRDRMQKYCLETNFTANFIDDKHAFEVLFQHQTVDSYYLRAELLLAAQLCEGKLIEACNHLAHMCLFTLDTNSITCQFLYNISTAENYFYMNKTIQEILKRRKVPPVYTLTSSSMNNKMFFSMATYTLQGQYERLNDLTPFCSSFNNIRFGVNTVKVCKVLAQDLLNTKVKFLVPYLTFFDQNNDKFLYEVPILIKNINMDVLNSSKWQLSRRFFTIDNINGFKAISSTENSIFTRASQLNAIRYIKSMKIQITMQSREKPGKIYPPLFVIEYGELSYQDLLNDKEISIDYRVDFNFDERITNIVAITIIIGVFGAIALIHGFLKTWFHYKKNNTYIYTLTTIFTLLIYCVETLGSTLLSISTFVCIYFLIFYKGQTVLYILLPNEEFEKIIMISTVIGFASKIIEISSFLYRHRQLNIFFLDWEQSRSILFPVKYDSPRTSLKKTYRGRFSRETVNLSVDEHVKKDVVEKKKRNSTKSKRHTNNKSKNTQSKQKISIPVSIWRTYFVASQWLRIKTRRKTSIWFQIVATILLIEVVGLKYWTLAMPELSLQEKSSVKKSFTLQYGVGVIIYIVIYIFQWTISTLYEKYVKSSLQEFVDLCSVANISLFIFSHNYYGYYIHGRSVHGFADTNLLTLINDLKKEELNLCAHRGLIPGTTNQTFIVCMSTTFRRFYNSLLEKKSSSVKNTSRRYLSMVPTWTECCKTYLKLRKFFCKFIDHCFTSLDYTVKEKSFLEKLCNIEFFKTNETTFYIDNNNSFDTTIFHGNEWTLATFEFSIFVCVLSLDGGYILSAIFTIFLSQLVTIIARCGQNRNLAKNTFIDRRFLM